jgi:predicted glutamine amidotransferase
MCIIFYNENGVKYNEGELRAAWNTNSDGVGVMWLDEGKVNVLHGMLSVDETVELMELFDGVPHALHLRFATHGPKVEGLCHPFLASPPEFDEEVWLMHNGVISGLNVPFSKSDTQVFAEQLQEMCRVAGTTDILFVDETIEMLERQIGTYNKVVLLRSDGEVAILNPDAFYVDKETGMWYSNRYSVRSYTYSTGWGGSNSDSLTANSPLANIVDLEESEEEDDDDDDDEEDWWEWSEDGWLTVKDGPEDSELGDGPLLLSEDNIPELDETCEDDSDALERWFAAKGYAGSL